MKMSNYDFGRIEQLVYYFEQAMQLSDYNQEAYDELQEVLERVRFQANAEDGYCGRCNGIHLEWAWELVNGNYNAGGFWFCPKCRMVLRPRSDGLWVETRLIAGEPKMSNDNHVMGREAIFLPRLLESDLDLKKKIEFVEKMKRDNLGAFEFLARSATDLLKKIEQDKEEEDE